MSRKKNKLKRRINEFGASVGMSPARIAMSVILVIGIGALIWFVAFPKASGFSKRVEDVPSGQKKKEVSLSIDQRLESLLNAKPPSVGNFLMVIEEMKARSKELEEIEQENRLTEAQQSKATLIRIRNEGVIVRYMLENSLDFDVEWAELRKLCESHLNDSDELVQEAAHYWLGLIPIIDFTTNPSEETYATFTEMISKHGKGYLDNPAHAMIFANWIKSMRQSNQPVEFIVRGHNFIGEQLRTSEVPLIKTIGEQMSQLSLYGGFNLQTLGSRISWRDPSAAADLAGAMATLKESVAVTKFETWATIIRAYENFLATDDIEAAGQMWQKMTNLVEGLPDSKMKTGLQEILEKQAKRALSIGTKFDVAGLAYPDNVPFGQADDTYTLIVFCNKRKESQVMLGKLRDAINQSQPNYSPVLVLEDELNEDDRKSMAVVPKVVKVAARETVLKYFKNFPVDFFPYLILIDKNGILVSANLDIDQVPNRIAKIEARRKANAGLGNTSGPSETVTQ